MRRLSPRWSSINARFLVPIIAVLAMATYIGQAYAFEPWNVPIWPNTTSSPMTNKVAVSGVVTWEAVDSYGYSNWEGEVARALDTGSSYSDSLGNSLNRFLAADSRGQIVIRRARAGETPDIRQYAASSAFVEAKCGTGSYTACVFLLNSLSVPAYYKAALMLTYSINARAAVMEHETFHAVGRACDQYRGGCPRATDGVWEGSVVCTGNPDTLMDCGGAAPTARLFDYQTFVAAYPASAAFLQVKQPLVCTDTGYDECTGQWKFADGTAYEVATSVWWLHGVPEWLPCNADGIRWNLYKQMFVPPLDQFHAPERGFWSVSPAC